MEREIPLARAHRPGATFHIPDFARGLIELGRRHELLRHMTVRHLKGQYKQSVLGYAWAFVNPLSQMLILSFVFSTIVKVDSQGIDYPLFVLMGLLPWMFFSNAVSSATDAVTGAYSLVTKVYFPREILPTAAVLTKVVDLGFGLLILVGMMVYFGEAPTETIVWVPVLFAIQFIFTLGLSLPLAALNLFYHDVRYLVGVTLTLWFYLTPIIYPVDIVPDKYKFMFDINPNSLLVNAYRRVVLLDQSPGAERLLLGLGIAVGTFVVGYYLFKRMEPGFADRI
jgi:ABC-type polysaccharide/polyol phosphate export permease